MRTLLRYTVFVTGLVGATAGSALAQIGPIDFQSTTSLNNSDDFKQVTVQCPPGTIAFSGGAGVGGSNAAEVLVHQTLPQGDPPTGWSAVAQERTPTAEPWTITAIALCATVAGYEMVEAMTPLDSTGVKVIEVDCPPGKSPIGGGGGIFFFNPDLAMYALRPTETGWLAAGREVASIAASWLVVVRVSCAPGLDREWFQAVSTQLSTESRDRLTMHCPPQRVALAGGALAQGSDTYAGFSSTRPFDDAEGRIVAWGTGTLRVAGSASWLVIQEVLCYLPIIFRDGFESGDTGVWSETEP